LSLEKYLDKCTERSYRPMKALAEEEKEEEIQTQNKPQVSYIKSNM